MDITTLVAVYLENGIDAVNDALKTLPNERQLYLLKELEKLNFEIKWHYSSDDYSTEPDFGIALAGPDGS